MLRAFPVRQVRVEQAVDGVDLAGRGPAGEFVDARLGDEQLAGLWRRKPFQDLRDLELATFRWVSWRGLEASAPVLGLQDTGTDRNRVLCKPSGASRPTIRAEQKSGHINRTDV